MNATSPREAGPGLGVHTYAEPLSGLRVSWGAILAGAVAILSIALLLLSLAVAIIFSSTHATAASTKGALIAVLVCWIITMLIGAFFGGALAGYLPGNYSRFIAGTHAFLAWSFAFVMATAFQLVMLSGLARTTASVATGTAAQVGQAAATAPGGLDQQAINLLRSLGYSEREATQMVQQGKAETQRALKNAPAQAPSAAAATADTAIDYAAGLSWAWWGTWFVAGLLSLAGGLLAARRMRGPQVAPPKEAAPAPRSPVTPPITPQPV
jgi:hypothetical protein